MALIREASAKIPLFYSQNMSFGVALLNCLAKIAAKALPDADIEIIEKHHNQKVDAPSGTALMLADAVKEVQTDKFLTVQAIFPLSHLLKSIVPLLPNINKIIHHA